MRRFPTSMWGTLVLLFAASPWNLQAQEVSARIRGTLTDASHRSVPGADVKATNTLTGVSASVPTSTAGIFEFLGLLPGTYDVTVTKSGFRTYIVRGIVLNVAKTYDLPVSLDLGPVIESVQVEANPVRVEITVTQLGSVVDVQQILDLPLNGRNWVELQQTIPGVVASSDRLNNNFATNGSQTQQNAYLINGVDTNDLPINTPLIIPSPDAIAEFNLVTSTINPEYGRNSGAIVNAIIRSGTNQWHGDAFEFYRDTALNTHNFFQTSVPVFHQHQFGGVFGGPIRKDHTFFFLSFQDTRSRNPQAGGGQVTVFSNDQRNGIFSDLATSTATSPFPLTGETGQVYPAGTQYRVIFPTGHIPTRDISPISQRLLAFVPPPNLPGNLFSFNPVTDITQHQGVARIDHIFNSTDTLWGTIFIHRSHSTSTLSGGATVPGFGSQNTGHPYVFQAVWNHTFNPTTLNEFRASYVRFNFDAGEPQNPVLPSSLGFNINPQNTTGAGVPLIDVTGLFSLGFSAGGPQPRIDENYQLVDNWSRVVDRHTWKFGFDGRRYAVTNAVYALNNGAYTFGASGQYTTGDAGADFMLGIPDSYFQSSGGFQVERTYEIYMYAQDSWRVSNKLTLNYGVGYQIDTPLQNKYFGGLDKNCFFPGQQSIVFPTAPLGLVFPGDKGCSSSGYSTHYDHFGPRFGFAYTPNLGWLSGGNAQKLVIRGGFGIYFNRTEEELAYDDLLSPPFSVFSSGIGDIGGSPSFASPFTDISSGQVLANKFPFVAPTPGQQIDFSFFEPISTNVTSPQLTSPYAMNYNLNVQRELPGAMLLQMGYVGAQGRHLEISYEGNPFSAAGIAACAASKPCTNNRSIQSVLYPSHKEFAPGDQIASVATEATVGNSNYNSLQVSLNKRLRQGLLFQLSYTYSHSIDNSSGFEDSFGLGVRTISPYNFAAYRGDSAFDARHRLVVSYDYELPHLTRYWNNALTRYVLNGWRLAGITTLQTGFPFLFSDANLRSLSCDAFSFAGGCPDGPNVNGPLSSLDPRTASAVNTVRSASNTTSLPYYWFNPSQFSRQDFGTFGNVGRNNFHGPGINSTDLALDKELQFSESRKIQLRLEAYNLFNHTQFIAPNGNVNSGNFGRILSARASRVVQLGAKFYF